MKKIFLLLVAYQIFSQECCYEEKSFWDYHPIHVGGNFIQIGSANLDPKHQPQDGQLTFNKGNAFAYIFLPISECSFFLPRVEWNTFTMDWNHNPRFNETHFHYMQFALTFLSQAVETWRWVARIDYNIDIKHFSHPRTYGLFSALLWGTHELNEKWHYHIGALGYTGFEGQEIYPIIGFDYAPAEKWLIQAIFPMNYSVEYALNKRWRFAIKGRPLKERFRTGGLEPSPRSVFSYSTFGAEFNVHYERFLQLELEFYAGYNFGGDFYIKNRHGHHALYTHLHGAPYGGISLNWGI